MSALQMRVAAVHGESAGVAAARRSDVAPVFQSAGEARARDRRAGARPVVGLALLLVALPA
jgi:hypothetical protein